MVLPSAWNTGSAASKSRLLTTHHDAEGSVDCAFLAARDRRVQPCGHPSRPGPCRPSARRAERSWTCRGRGDPCLAPSMMPSLPRATSSTSGEFGSMVMRTSTWAATSLGEDAALGPGADQLVDRPLAAAVHHHGVAGLQQVLGHRASHDSEPNHSNGLRHGHPHGGKKWRDDEPAKREVTQGRATSQARKS